MKNNLKIQREFDKLLKQTKAKYDATAPINCPAFPSEQVYFTQFGFRHFLYNSTGRRRTLLASIMRLKIFDHAVEVIKKATVATKRPTIVKSDRKIINLWSITMVVRSKNICVVIRQKGNNGQKHFLSVLRKN